MNKQITVPFQVTLWDLKPFDETPDNPTLSRGTVKKTFDGEFKGESVGEILMYSAVNGSAGYTIMDKVSGELRGRAGSFVIMHGATHTPEETSRAGGIIAPNSGTGELRGISGTVEFKSDENGKSIILDFAFADEN
ncbi:MAG: DUF3224 domain-containing protein [Acidobacteria bacterium]|nr:DUF3224 domain-containing protein [Acidobacteriota bacterium]